MTKKGIVFTIVGAIAAAGLAVGIPFAVTALSVPEGKMPDSVYKALEHDYPLLMSRGYDWYYGAYGKGHVFLMSEDEPSDSGRTTVLEDCVFKMDRSCRLYYWQQDDFLGSVLLDFRQAYYNNFVDGDGVKSIAKSHERYARKRYEEDRGKSSAESAAWYSDRTNAVELASIEPSVSREIRKARWGRATIETEYDERKNPCMIEDYMGSFSGAHVAYVLSYPFMFLDMMQFETLAGYEFCFGSVSDPLRVVKDGVFYPSLTDAYEADVLHDEDIPGIYAQYSKVREMVPNGYPL